MLIFSPIVLTTSIYVGLVYGYLYLLFTSFESVFSTVYGFSTGLSGLTYIGFGVGCIVGLLLFGLTSDKMSERMSNKSGGEHKPEYRLVPLVPGSLIIPIGLLWYVPKWLQTA